MMSAMEVYLPRAAILSLGVCLLYAVASTSLSMLNKALLTSYGFECYFMLLATQLGISYLICVVSRDYFGNPMDVPKFSWQLLREFVFELDARLLPLAFANVVVGVCPLEHVHSTPIRSLVPRIFAGLGLWALLTR